MQLFIESMNEQTAQDLHNWKYDKPYDFYNNECADEEKKERLDGTVHITHLLMMLKN
ncbi:hypothetical protein [Paenisporosarcina indica]|uniref:hypothetical protein n=1 Tax=Paenisporosarcina indica TaxID=650093 RepID=UPI000A458ABE|nr:hypothetical protein [Paenisporosarcina indica]